MRDGLGLQLKPVGSHCNLRCKYCYARPFLSKSLEIMNKEVLERAISSCILNSEWPKITWHGGEPTLAGLKFYRNAQDIIEKYRGSGQKISQVLQTNGVLIDKEFARFFEENGFEIGISIDGPKNIHNINRIKKSGKGTFDDTMRGLEILRQEGINPSVIATVTVETLKFAGEVFDFLIKNGFRSIKYSPVFDTSNYEFNIADEQWYRYLCVIFDRWMEYGDSDVSVMQLDEIIAWLDSAKDPYPMCSSASRCIQWVSVDPDGSMYPCAYFKAEMSYGNILEIPLIDVIKTHNYKHFRSIFITPPKKCRKCNFYSFCGNGCPSIRVDDTKINPEGVYVYCGERRRLFKKIERAFRKEIKNSE